MGSCRSDSGKKSVVFVPRAFNSTVQPWSSSCTSCGSTVLRVHASSHLGFGGAASIASCCAPFLTFDGPSRPLSLEKKLGIAGAGVERVSRRDACDLGRSLGKKSRQCDAQTAGRRLCRLRQGSRETGRWKRQIVSKAGVGCVLLV
jgi:hypothetical protein